MANKKYYIHADEGTYRCLKNLHFAKQISQRTYNDILDTYDPKTQEIYCKTKPIYDAIMQELEQKKVGLIAPTILH